VIQARLVLRPQIVIGSLHEKVRDGRLIDEAALRFVLAGVDDLLKETRALCSSGGLNVTAAMPVCSENLV
jgi:hypothetical protein